MATELDALQLNFTARTSDADKSLERLITQLTKVGQSIGAINSQGFIASMDNVSSTLSNLEFAVNNINSDKLKSISSGLNSLAKSMSNFASGGNVSETLSQVASGIDAIGNVANMDFSNISVLANSISKLGSGGGTQASQNLIPIAEGLKAFTGINIPQLDGIETFANGLRSLGSKNVGVAANSLQPIANALRNFPTNIPAVSGLTELAQSLSLFGRKTAQEAVTTIPQLATAFRQLIAELASAPAVSNNIVQLTDALARFVSNVNRVGTSSTQASKGLNLFGNTASKVSKKSFSLAAAIGKIYATYFLLFRAFGKIRDAIDISSQLKEVENVVNTTFGNMTDKVNEFAQSSIKNFGMSELSAKQYASRFQAMGVAMAIPAQSVAKAQQQLNKINPALASRGYSDTADSIADMSINITKLTADMASFYNVAQEDVAKDLESIWTGQTRPLRAYGLDLTNATLQEWALKNGIDANIKSMSQAEKTLLRYQYVMANTSAVQGDFSKTSLTWANQIRILGQNFQRLGAVIGSGFIAWLRPMIVQVNAAMDSIIAAVQRVVNALGRIFGWQMIVDTTGEQLIDDTEGVADAWDDATGAAKKYAKQLLGIDELNNLTTNDGGGSGSDSGLGGGLSGGNIIQPGGISFEKFESDIDNLYDLGKTISDKLRDMLSGIDWQSIYQKAENFGSGFAQFLNGLFQPETFYQTGRAIAGALNTVISALFGFGTTFDWANFGESIGERINGFFYEFDFAKLAQTLNVWVQGIWKAIKKAISTIEWKDVFAGLYDFVSNLDIETVALIIGAITIKKVGKWLFTAATWKGLGKALSAKLSPIVSSALFKASASVVTTIIGQGGLLSFLTADIGALIGTGSTAVIGTTIGSAIAGSLLAWLAGNAIGKKVGELLFPDQKEVYENFKWIGEGGFFDTLAQDWSTAFSPITDGIKAIGQAISDTFSGIADWFDTNLFSPIAMMASDLWDGITSIFSDAYSWFDTYVISPLSTFFKDVTTAIGNFFSNAWDTIKGMWEAVSGWFDTYVIQPISTFFSDLSTSISTFLSNAWDSIKGVWSLVSGWFDTTVIQPLSSAFETVTETIGGLFSSLWDDIQSGAKSLANGIIGLFEGAVNGIINGINGFLGIFNGVVSAASKITGDDWSGVTLIPTISLPRFETGGFPTQGSLFVAGETYGQSEWIGNINGRTGVVPQNEITGIAEAIYQTSAEEMSMLRQQVNLLSGILEKEFGISTNDIGKAARSYGRDYHNRTGNNAYVF